MYTYSQVNPLYSILAWVCMGIVYETCILKDAVFCFVFVAVWVYLFSKANYVYTCTYIRSSYKPRLRGT